MKYKHKLFRQLTEKQRAYYLDCITEFVLSKIEVDEFRDSVSLLEEEIEENIQ